MDVTCEQCKAEYDFDDTLLGDKGTTVKCSKCGHVFRVLPPSREPTRSALKVRFARDGHVESVASLRELQQRIQAGEVGVDDQLGRDGFTFRRLGDVPELKNFFVRSGSSPLGSLPASAAPSRGPEARPAPKRTVMGLGPSDIPSAPRVPNFGKQTPSLPAAGALSPTQPGPRSAKATVQGRAPVSSAPTAPSMAIPPRDPPSQRVPLSTAPTASGTAPTVQAPLYGGSATIPAGPNYAPPPSANRPASTAPGSLPAPHAGLPAQPGPTAPQPAAPQPVRLRIPDSVPPGVARAPSTPARAPASDSIAPGALRAAVQPLSARAPEGALRHQGSPSANPGGPVRLQLDEDDAPGPRRSSSSRLVVYALLLLALGGAGWFAASKLTTSEPQQSPLADAMEGAEPAANSAPVEPAVAPEVADAGQAAAEASPEASVGAEKEPAAQVAEPEPTPEKAPSAATKSPAKASKAAAQAASERSKEAPAAESSSTRDPKDYAGWVSRGEQSFSRGDIGAAQEAFEAAIALRASGSEANSGLGAVLLAQGKTREAVGFLSRAASNGFAEANVGLGDAYRKLGQKDDAIEAYETYLARLPKGSRANYVRLQLEGLGKDTKAADESPTPSAPSNEYRPAGELTETPSPSAGDPRPTEPERESESE